MTSDQQAGLAAAVGLIAVAVGVALIMGPAERTDESPVPPPTASVVPETPPPPLPNQCGRFGLEVTYLSSVPKAPSELYRELRPVETETSPFPEVADKDVKRHAVDADTALAWREDHDGRKAHFRTWTGDGPWEDLPSVDLPRWAQKEEQFWHDSQVKAAIDYPSRPTRMGFNNGVRTVKVLELDLADRTWIPRTPPKHATQLGSEYAVGPWEPNQCLFPCYGLEEDLVRWGVDPGDVNDDENFETLGVQHKPCLSVRRSPDEPWTRIETTVPMIGRVCQRLDENRILASRGVNGYVIFPTFVHQVDIVDLQSMTARTVIPSGASLMVTRAGDEIVWLGLDGMRIFNIETEAVEGCELPKLRFEPKWIQASEVANSVVVARDTIPPSAAQLTVIVPGAASTK